MSIIKDLPLGKVSQNEVICIMDLIDPDSDANPKYIVRGGRSKLA